jgi:hypothetical protein
MMCILPLPELGEAFFIAWTCLPVSGTGGVNQDETQPNTPDPSGTAGDIFLAPEPEDSPRDPFEEPCFAERQI